MPLHMLIITSHWLTATVQSIYATIPFANCCFDKQAFFFSLPQYFSASEQQNVRLYLLCVCNDSTNPTLQVFIGVGGWRPKKITRKICVDVYHLWPQSHACLLIKGKKYIYKIFVCFSIPHWGVTDEPLGALSYTKRNYFCERFEVLFENRDGELKGNSE